MNTFNDNDLANRQLRDWSAHVGTLAADHATSTTAVPSRLSAILDRLRHLHRTRQEVHHNYKAHAFIMGD